MNINGAGVNCPPLLSQLPNLREVNLMYIYDRILSVAQSLPTEGAITKRFAQRNSHYPDSATRGSLRHGWSNTYVRASGGLEQFSTERVLWPHLSDDQDKTKQRKGTQVLYVRPTPPKPKVIGKIEHAWSFNTADGRLEYETALHKHLKDKKIVSADTVYEPLSSSTDIANLASNKFARLVLIVHSAADGPAIAVDLGSSAAGAKADWMKDDKFANVMAPLEYTSITVLGCDSVSNKFTPNLAKRLPTGSTVIGHKGGNFVIRRHFEPNKDVPGRLRLTRVSSNLRLKVFKTQAERAAGSRPSQQPHSVGP